VVTVQPPRLLRPDPWPRTMVYRPLWNRLVRWWTPLRLVFRVACTLEMDMNGNIWFTTSIQVLASHGQHVGPKIGKVTNIKVPKVIMGWLAPTALPYMDQKGIYWAR